MKIIDLKTIEATGTVEIGLTSNKQGDAAVQEVIVQTVTDNPFTVSAYVADEEPTEVKVIDMAKIAVAENTDTAGVYMIVADGYKKLDIKFAGSGIAVIKKLG